MKLLNKKRAAAIVIHNNQLLVMQRKKPNKTYFTFPGGSIEQAESATDAALRELYEETSIIAKSPRLLYELTINNIPSDTLSSTSNKEFFFWCDYVSGQPQLHPQSPEYQYSSEQNFFNPIWIPISEIKNINLYPPQITQLLVHDLEFGLDDHTQKITLDYKTFV